MILFNSLCVFCVVQNLHYLLGTQLKGVILFTFNAYSRFISLEYSPWHDATEQELNSMKEELSRTKQSLCRLQIDRQEMKRRMKSKVDLIQKQEQILASRELQSIEEQEQLEDSTKSMMRMQHEMETLKKELDNANSVIEENKKTLAKNQQASK